jgi:hypothetical protein
MLLLLPLLFIALCISAGIFRLPILISTSSFMPLSSSLASSTRLLLPLSSNLVPLIGNIISSFSSKLVLILALSISYRQSSSVTSTVVVIDSDNGMLEFVSSIHNELE